MELLYEMGNIMSSNNEAHGDEDEIEAIARQCAEELEAEIADNWKFNEDRLEIYEHE